MLPDTTIDIGMAFIEAELAVVPILVEAERLLRHWCGLAFD
jgi:hypothetical protein